MIEQIRFYRGIWHIFMWVVYAKVCTKGYDTHELIRLMKKHCASLARIYEITYNEAWQLCYECYSELYNET